MIAPKHYVPLVRGCGCHDCLHEGGVYYCVCPHHIRKYQEAAQMDGTSEISRYRAPIDRIMMVKLGKRW